MKTIASCNGCGILYQFEAEEMPKAVQCTCESRNFRVRQVKD